MERGIVLYENFKTEFFNRLVCSNEDEKRSLRDDASRTSFYKTIVMPHIANRLGLLYEQNEELLRIDYTFYKKGTTHNHNIPVIFIESENKIKDEDAIQKEMVKLLSVNSELKVFISIADMNDKECQYGFEGQDFKWDYMIPDFLEVSRLIGCFAVFILDKDLNNITIHCKCYDAKGEIVDKSKLSEK